MWSQIVAGFVSGAIVLAEFEHTTMPHFLAHCAAVVTVVIGVIGLVYGEQVRAFGLISAGFSASFLNFYLSNKTDKEL